MTKFFKEEGDINLEKIGVKKIQKIDIEIMVGLYEYRALSIEQIQKRYNLTKGYCYKKLHVLKQSKWVTSHAIKNYKKNQHSQGKYYRLTERGLTVLKEEGVPITKKAHHLHVADLYIPFLLHTNDMMIALEQYGWQLIDSRETKERFNLNRSDNIQGVLQNVKTGSSEYGIYVFMEGTRPENIVKATREIQNHNSIINYILFTKGKDTFQQMVEALINEKTKNGGKAGTLVAGKNSIKILPYTFGKNYFQLFEQDEEMIRFAETAFSTSLSFKSSFERNKVKNNTLRHIVEHNGEEKFFVNLIDTDLKKISDINLYHVEDYEKDGRKVLVLTHIRDIHERYLNDIHHLEYLEVNPNQVINYLNNF